MFKSIAVLALLALATSGVAAASCSGANLAISSLAVKNMTSGGDLNHYQISAVVTNVGTLGQPSNTLQFVDIYRDTQKLDAKGIPPLKPGQSYQFVYTIERAADAGPGSSRLKFTLDELNAAGAPCNTNSSSSTVTF